MQETSTGTDRVGSTIVEIHACDLEGKVGIRVFGKFDAVRCHQLFTVLKPVGGKHHNNMVKLDAVRCHQLFTVLGPGGRKHHIKWHY